MIDLSTINNAGEIFTVFLKDEPTISYDENNNEVVSYLGGIGYWSGLPLDTIVSVTDVVVPVGLPYIILLREYVPYDYDINLTFIATLDFENPDGYGQGSI